MARTTIGYGIDLGTTNSAIAVLDGTDVRVFKNNEDAELTASAVWIDRKGRLYTGRQAKERVESDPMNATAEFKLLMGTTEEKVFERNGQRMKPEELSAEILKSLRDDVLQREGEDLRAAVITVPAAFDLNQCEATKRAAQLAGLETTPLLQEPTSAALAYGFQSETDNAFWLVYDLGGGTFDAAVIRLADGEFSVVTHGGDPHLGGKLIDWAIVDQLLVPAVRGQYPLTDFRRSNRAWFGAIQKLKLAAEAAKIRLSRQSATEITIDFLCKDDGGGDIEFYYELRRSDVVSLAEPIIRRSLNICKTTLKEAGLDAGHIERTILVGGPTLAPYLRELVADADGGLGVQIDYSIDPLTVVARGAAIFAGTQRLEAPPIAPQSDRQYVIDLEYDPVGPDSEPLVGGTVRASGQQDLSGLTIRFANPESQRPWRSGKVPVSSDGTFMTTLWAEKGRANTFQLELRDAAGRKCHPVPDHLTYTIGKVETAPLLTHSISVALANNEVVRLVEKGARLPVRRPGCTLRTAWEVGKDRAGDVLRIPVVEGEHPRADRNRRIGVLEVQADRLRRTLPAGSEVLVTIEIDASRLVVTKAFVPFLDEEFADPVNLRTEAAPDPGRLQEDVEREKERLEAVRGQAAGVDDPRADEILRQIETEQLTQELDDSLEASRVEPEAALKCERRVLDLRATLDELEHTVEWPALVNEAERQRSLIRPLFRELGTSDDRSELTEYEESVDEAIRSHDPELLRGRTEELRRFGMRLLERTGILPRAFFEQLSGMVSQMTNPRQAERLIAEGQRAQALGQLSALSQINRQLADLLPSAPPAPDMSTLIR